jgi:hypothetical protein
MRDNLSRKEATKFLSHEFVAGLVIQTLVFLILGGYVWGQTRADIQALQKEQDKAAVVAVSPERIARMETQLTAVAKGQDEQNRDIKTLTEAVVELKTEVRRAIR